MNFRSQLDIDRLSMIVQTKDFLIFGITAFEVRGLKLKKIYHYDLKKQGDLRNSLD